MKRAVITGIGIISSIGNNKKEVLKSLKEGKSGITFSKEFKRFGMKSHVCGSIKLNLDGLIKRKFLRFMNDATIYTYLSMKEAILDAKLHTSQYQNNPRVGLIVGSGGNSTSKLVLNKNMIYKNKISGKISPYCVIKSMSSATSACLSTFFKIHGASYSISSACATSTHCIGNAVEQIKIGNLDIVFAGGGEEVSSEMACKFDAMNALSTHFNNEPQKSSRTYDKHRDGFVISGGGGIVVIEELEHAKTRKAKIYSEIIGYGATSDGENMVIPSCDGAIRSMKLALREVNTEVDYINVHGTSTVAGDVKELNAIRAVFGNKIPALSSTKSITGHALGAAGVHEIIYTLIMMQNNFISPSINIDHIEDSAKNMNIITTPTKMIINTAMSNGFGFGGTNASIVVRKIT